MLRTIAAFLLACLSLVAGTRVRDVIYDAAGKRASGQVVISWPAFTSAASGRAIPQGSTTVKIVSGVLDVDLEPTPPGTYYSVRYYFSTGGTRVDTWAIPLSATPITVAQARAGGNPVPIPDTALLGGDLSGPPAYATVERIKGLPVDATTKQDGQALKWDQASNTIKFGPVAAEGGGTAAGDVTGSLMSTKVEKIQGVPVEPSAPQDGQMMRYSGANSRWDKVTLVDQETPTGAINGTNRVFTLSATPNPLNGLMVFRNGIAQKRCPAAVCDYDVAGNTITFIPEATPQPGDALVVWFRY
jgi:hypothetical protein